MGEIAPNILDRQFTAEAPNEKWITDISAFKLFGEKLYVSPVLDLFNGEIITYTIGSRPTFSLVSDMLKKTLERLPEDHQLTTRISYRLFPWLHSSKNYFFVKRSSSIDLSLYA